MQIGKETYKDIMAFGDYSGAFLKTIIAKDDAQAGKYLESMRNLYERYKNLRIDSQISELFGEILQEHELYLASKIKQLVYKPVTCDGLQLDELLRDMEKAIVVSKSPILFYSPPPIPEEKINELKRLTQEYIKAITDKGLDQYFWSIDNNELVINHQWAIRQDKKIYEFEAEEILEHIRICMRENED